MLSFPSSSAILDRFPPPKIQKLGVGAKHGSAKGHTLSCQRSYLGLLAAASPFVLSRASGSKGSKEKEQNTLAFKREPSFLQAKPRPEAASHSHSRLPPQRPLFATGSPNLPGRVHPNHWRQPEKRKKKPEPPGAAPPPLPIPGVASLTLQAEGQRLVTLFHHGGPQVPTQGQPPFLFLFAGHHGTALGALLKGCRAS